MLLNILVIGFSLFYAYRTITLLGLIRDDVSRLAFKIKDLGDLNERIVSLRDQIRTTEKTIYMVKDEISRLKAHNDTIYSTKAEFEAFGKEIKALQDKFAENTKKMKS